jgi:hypothetical protein
MPATFTIYSICGDAIGNAFAMTRRSSLAADITPRSFADERSQKAAAVVLTARSSHTSLLVLPVQFSHWWQLVAQPENKAIRAVQSATARAPEPEAEPQFGFEVAAKDYSGFDDVRAEQRRIPARLFGKCLHTPNFRKSGRDRRGSILHTSVGRSCWRWRATTDSRRAAAGSDRKTSGRPFAAIPAIACAESLDRVLRRPVRSSLQWGPRSQARSARSLGRGAAPSAVGLPN